MTKVKTPLLSYSADGSIGKEITYAKTITGTIAKAIPTHPDAKTLPQTYQRWLYTDAWWAWYALTPAERQTWHTNARPFRLTGWQYWIKKYLIIPTDLVLWMRLDEPSGATAYDSSKHGKNATIYGASPIAGVIDLCRSYDAIDDRLEFPNDSFNYTQFTVAFWQKTAITGKNVISNYIRASAGAPEYGWFTTIRPNGRPAMQINDAAWDPAAGPLVNDNQLHHIAYTIATTIVKVFTDGVYVDTWTAPAPPSYAVSVKSYLGARWEAARTGHWSGLQDEVRLYTRILSDDQIKNIAERLYPS